MHSIHALHHFLPVPLPSLLQGSLHLCVGGCPSNGLMVEHAGGATAGRWWSLQLLTQNTNFTRTGCFLIMEEGFFHPQKPFCSCPSRGSGPRCHCLIGPTALRREEWQQSSSSICQATDLSPLACACPSQACGSQSRKKEKGSLERGAIAKAKG